MGPAYGGVIGYQGTWDHVYRLTCYAIVPATDDGVSSTAPTRDAVVGSPVVGYVL